MCGKSTLSGRERTSVLAPPVEEIQGDWFASVRHDALDAAGDGCYAPHGDVVAHIPLWAEAAK
ncbi:hypothetical protein ACFWFI_14660 [Streptomyces sp. NPDC060209]|uniref:hypothetical protein n=1 Tax=Streptomyces sp. NPDC060209 TaxID=3347073 RepID=UPI00364F1893